MKTFYIQNNIGTARYCVSFHDGITLNRDGSKFFGIRIFSNKKKLARFVKELKNSGYQEA